MELMRKFRLCMSRTKKLVKHQCAGMIFLLSWNKYAFFSQSRANWMISAHPHLAIDETKYFHENAP